VLVNNAAIAPPEAADHDEWDGDRRQSERRNDRLYRLEGGLNAMTKAMAHRYGRDGIRVNNLAPGHNALPMGLGFKGWQSSSNRRAMRAAAGLLGSEGNAWDLAYSALFLASDESRWITAATIPVDAGATEVFPIVMHEHLAAAAHSPS
jgi:hypothetical protein